MGALVSKYSRILVADENESETKTEPAFKLVLKH